MRIAVQWQILGDALEPAWERLRAAAARLARRQPTTDDTTSAMAVVEAAFRDPDVRVAILPAKSATLVEIVETVVDAFGSAWVNGLSAFAEQRSGVAPLLLGPAFDLWPHIIGQVLRIALHLEYRLRNAESVAEAVPEIQDANDADAVPAASTPAPPAPRNTIEEALDQLSLLLTSENTMASLERMEAMVLPSVEDSPAAKRNRCATLPAPECGRAHL